MSFKIGVDGGGTKTECILVNAEGTVVAVHVGTGCNPSVVGPDQARSIVVAALDSLRAQAGAHAAGLTRTPFGPAPEISETLLCMAGSRGFWGEFAERCSYYGMRAILALYMVEKLGVDKSDAGTFMSLFIAACYAFPLVGGWVADNFLGKYWTIVLFSVPYVAAQFLVGIEDKYLVFGALLIRR